MSAASDLREKLETLWLKDHKVRDDFVDAILDAVIAALPEDRVLPDEGKLMRLYYTRNDINAALGDVRRLLESAKTQKGEE